MLDEKSICKAVREYDLIKNVATSQPFIWIVRKERLGV